MGKEIEADANEMEQQLDGYVKKFNYLNATVERACLDSREPHKCLAFGEYDVEGNFIAPVPLPNLHVLQQTLEAVYGIAQRIKEDAPASSELNAQSQRIVEHALQALQQLKSTQSWKNTNNTGLKFPEITEHVAKPLEPGVCPECAGECQVLVNTSLPGAPQCDDAVRCFTCQGSGRVPIKPEGA